MKRLKNALRFIKKSPLLCLLAASGLLFGAFGLCGRQGIYRDMAGSLLDQPAAAVVFLGAREGIYPWELFGKQPEGKSGGDEGKGNEETGLSGPEQAADGPEQPESPGGPERLGSAGGPEQSGSAGGPEQTGDTADVNVAGAGGRLDQVTQQQAQELADQSEAAARKGQREEGAGSYGGTVSAGTVSENNSGNAAWEDPDPAALYSFTQVDDSYFDDALFIGDSRMVGLQDYTALAEHADFYVRTALTVWEIFSEPKAFIKDEETGKKLTVEEALSKKQYGKIYLMVGINELGRGTPQSFAGEYEKVLNRLQELQPQALIFIQAIMHVGKEKNETDPIFNNSNIVARNDAISIFANNHNIFYLDGNSVVCDADGNLREDWTFDQVHLLGVYYDRWREYLLTKGILRGEQQE